MNTETVKIKIRYTHVWKEAPFLILGQIDEKNIFIDPSGQKEKIFISKIDLPIGQHKFSIHLQNKIPTDQYTFINIDFLAIDDQIINDKIYNESVDYFDYFGARKLGLNGRWTFNFKTPIYEWLLNYI